MLTVCQAQRTVAKSVNKMLFLPSMRFLLDREDSKGVPRRQRAEYPDIGISGKMRGTTNGKSSIWKGSGVCVCVCVCVCVAATAGTHNTFVELP